MPNEYADPGYARAYLAAAGGIPHRAEGEAVLLSFLPERVGRLLDLGAGDGRLLALALQGRPDASGVALDASPTMIEALDHRFGGVPNVERVAHDLDDPLPDLGRFDAVVSGFAIHHCADARKRTLYAEIFRALAPGGWFLNLEHVASATPSLHGRFLAAMKITPGQEDPSNRLAPVDLQLGWLRAIGYDDVDCYWKWLELALFGGRKPEGA